MSTGKIENLFDNVPVYGTAPSKKGKARENHESLNVPRALCACGRPNVYQKSRQSPAPQGVDGFPYFRMSTRCLPILFFYIENIIFNGFSSCSCNFSPLCKGRDTAVAGAKCWKTSKFLDKTAKIVSKRLNLRRLPNGTNFHLLSRIRPLSGRKIL